MKEEKKIETETEEKKILSKIVRESKINKTLSKHMLYENYEIMLKKNIYNFVSEKDILDEDTHLCLSLS